VKNPWRQLGGMRRPVWLLFSAILVNRAGTMALPFLLLYLTGPRGFTAPRAALAMAVYGVGAMLTAPLSGRLADRIGPRRVVIASLLISGVLLMPLPWLRSLGAILGLTFAWSVTGEALRPASMAWMTSLVPAEKRRAGFALSRLAVNIGMSLGPAVAGFVVRASFAAVFVLDAATSLLAGLLLLVAAGRDSEAPAAGSASAAEAALPAPVDGAALDDEAPPARPARPDSPHAFADRRFLYFLLALLPSMIVFFQDQSTLPLYLVHDLHLRESSYGLMFTLNTLMVIFIEVPLVAATSGWRHQRVLALGALLIGTGFGLLAFVHDFTGAMLTVVVWTFGEMVLVPASGAFVADAAPAGRSGEYLGLYSMTFSGAFAIAPWIGAQVLHSMGPRAIWIAAAGTGALSALLLSRVRMQSAPRVAAGRPSAGGRPSAPGPGSASGPGSAPPV